MSVSPSVSVDVMLTVTSAELRVLLLNLVRVFVFLRFGESVSVRLGDMVGIFLSCEYRVELFVPRRVFPSSRVTDPDADFARDARVLDSYE